MSGPDICPVCGVRCCVVGHRCSKRRLRAIEREMERADGDDADPDEPTEVERLEDGFALIESNSSGGGR